MCACLPQHPWLFIFSSPDQIFHYTTKRKELFSLKGTSFVFWIGELVGKHLYIYLFIVHAFILTDRELYVIHQIFTRVREKTHTDFLDRGSLLTRMLLNQWFLLVTSSLRKIYDRRHAIVDRYGIFGDETMDKRKSTKGQTTIYKTKEQVRRTPLMAPVVLI
jgi:hypothetical protein